MKHVFTCERNNKGELNMAQKFVIEFGMGVDLHGQDINDAAEKAVKDAISRSCLIGLNEICGFTEDTINEEMFIEAIIGVTRPEELNVEKIKKLFPVGQVTVKAEKGGLMTSGLYFPIFGDSDNSIEVAIAGIIVSIQKNRAE